MSKGVLISLLIAAVGLSAFLAYRLRSQAEEFARARQAVGWLGQENEVLSTLLNGSGMDQETARAILQEAYPGDSLGPYTRHFIVRGVDLHFTRDSLFHISAPVGGWACGPLLGCESGYDSRLEGRAAHALANTLESLAYPLLALGFGTGAFVLWRRRRSGRAERRLLAIKLGGALLVLSVLVAWVSGEVYMSIALAHGLSPELLNLAWNEVGRRLGVGFILSSVLVLASRLPPSRAAEPATAGRQHA